VGDDFRSEFGEFLAVRGIGLEGEPRHGIEFLLEAVFGEEQFADCEGRVAVCGGDADFAGHVD
jgi:hypothetical protein